MKDKKVYRWFNIAQYEEEEKWLNQMALEGWRLTAVDSPCVYTFSRTEPEDMIYHLELEDRPVEEDEEYLTMVNDYGWDYFTTMMGWRYYRRIADVSGNSDFFTDDASRFEMARNVARKRLLPVTIVMAMIMIWFIYDIVSGELKTPSAIFSVVAMVIYLIVLIPCVLGMYRLYRKYGR